MPDGSKAAFRRTGPAERLTGTVTCWDDGTPFGFITGEDQTSFFVSQDDLPRGYRRLPVGMRVSFAPANAPEPGKRHLRARSVQPLETERERAYRIWLETEGLDPERDRIPPDLAFAAGFDAGRFEQLLDRSSLGTPAARRLREIGHAAVDTAAAVRRAEEIRTRKPR